MGLVQPSATVAGAGGGHGLIGQIEVGCPHDVDAVLADEQPEAATRARVDVKQLVLPVPFVIPEAHVDNPVIAQSVHQSGRRLGDSLVPDADAERRRARMRTGLTKLFGP